MQSFIRQFNINAAKKRLQVKMTCSMYCGECIGVNYQNAESIEITEDEVLEDVDEEIEVDFEHISNEYSIKISICKERNKNCLFEPYLFEKYNF